MKIAVLLALLLIGCGNTPNQYAECTVPIKRNAGMGVYVDGCAVWTINTMRRDYVQSIADRSK